MTYRRPSREVLKAWTAANQRARAEYHRPAEQAARRAAKRRCAECSRFTRADDDLCIRCRAERKP